ncbi:MAG: hypothetical protein AB1Z98_32125 [Nannocystaceae bacterium]
MLRALETFLSAPVDAALPGNVDVELGPYYVPTSWPNNLRVVLIHARRLEVLTAPPPQDDDAPAFLLETATWPSDGLTSTFVLPGSISGTIYEVEAPPGIAAVRGDDYQVEGDTLRFYRAPTSGNPGVMARVRTDDAYGYTRRRLCAITLQVASYAEFLDDVDSAFSIALQVVLAQLTRVPRLELPVVPGLDVLLRVLEPRASIVEIERFRVEGIEPPCAVATLRVEGRLDMLVANGVPDPTSLIESIVGEVETDSSNGEEPVPEPIDFVPPPPAP